MLPLIPIIFAIKSLVEIFAPKGFKMELPSSDDKIVRHWSLKRNDCHSCNGSVKVVSAKGPSIPRDQFIETVESDGNFQVYKTYFDLISANLDQFPVWFSKFHEQTENKLK